MMWTRATMGCVMERKSQVDKRRFRVAEVVERRAVKTDVHVAASARLALTRSVASARCVAAQLAGQHHWFADRRQNSGRVVSKSRALRLRA